MTEKRWDKSQAEKEDNATACDRMQSDANVSERMRTDAMDADIDIDIDIDRHIDNKKKNTKKEKGEFDKFWELYPKKVGKGLAQKSYQSALKKIDHSTLTGSLTQHIANWERERTDKKYRSLPLLIPDVFSRGKIQKDKNNSIGSQGAGGANSCLISNLRLSPAFFLRSFPVSG